ncbi:hypothetical protein CEXT_114941 [Caerostris extrusa]|uniref:Uncharacterized protein n=1 Tax=Caerostris extrusa TaxID=172846 RepID=A0AAV4SK13_CAEEX|nr:hypothetical protein CEXT_114941 [Caerostris extrusa]
MSMLSVFCRNLTSVLLLSGTAGDPELRGGAGGWGGPRRRRHFWSTGRGVPSGLERLQRGPRAPVRRSSAPQGAEQGPGGLHARQAGEVVSGRGGAFEEDSGEESEQPAFQQIVPEDREPVFRAGGGGGLLHGRRGQRRRLVGISLHYSHKLLTVWMTYCILFSPALLAGLLDIIFPYTLRWHAGYFAFALLGGLLDILLPCTLRWHAGYLSILDDMLDNFSLALLGGAW